MTDKDDSGRNLVVVPIHNEARYVAGVIEEVKKYVCENADILAIDDGSTDATPEILKKTDGITVITHPANLGYGKTLIDGFEYAMRNGYRHVVTIDCDWQHEPSHIREFCELLDQYDIISGSRYLRASHEAPPEDRQSVNAEITRIINGITGYGLTDSFCGFKAYNVDSLRKLDLTEENYGMPLQLWIQAWKKGLTVKEIPVALIYFDRTRQFPGDLRKMEARLKYYRELIEREVANG